MPSSEPTQEPARPPRYRGPVLLRGGFRLFFPAAALFAALAAVSWLALLAAGWTLPSPLAAPVWHGHEMLFGYVAAVIAGFLLTAIPNWTGRLPVAGAPLAALVALWFAGRIAMFAGASWPVAAAVVDAAFLLVLAGLAWREVVAGANIRNAPICLIISVIALGNAGWHWAVLTDGDAGLFARAALAAVALLIALIGGRVTSSFTRNWMVKAGHATLPSAFGGFDKLALLGALAALVVWVALPEDAITGVLFGLAAALHAARLVRWRGWRTTAEPLVLILHLGYAWLPVWFALSGLSILTGAPDASSALHALTAGAAGTMTLAVMSRAMLGHTGRALTAGPATVAAYGLVIAGAALRVMAPFLPVDTMVVITIAGLSWSTGFVVFFAVYGPMGWRDSA
ncbi:MAG: NnrS family protein [Alphaproteobacteria bacterium]